MDHIDGSVLLQLAERHRVLPIVYEVLKTSEYIPNEALQMLKHEAIRKQMQMLTLSRTLLLMLQQWQQAGIECLILKGIPLANQLYGSVALRPARDLDILIDPKQYEVVELWLLQNGYQEKSGFSQMSDRFKRFMIRRTSGHYHSTFVHEQSGEMVEIHWRLQRQYDPTRTFAKLLERSRIVEIASYPVRVLAAEDEFTYLLEHGARHIYIRLRWLLDIVLFAQQRPDLVTELVNAPHSSPMLRVLLEQADMLSVQILRTNIITDSLVHHPNKHSSSYNRSLQLANLATSFIFAEHEHTDPSFASPMYWAFKRYHWVLHPTWFARIRLLTRLINLHNGWRLQRKCKQSLKSLGALFFPRKKNE
jgi:hypothetical protein